MLYAPTRQENSALLFAASFLDACSVSNVLDKSSVLIPKPGTPLFYATESSRSPSHLIDKNTYLIPRSVFSQLRKLDSSILVQAIVRGLVFHAQSKTPTRASIFAKNVAEGSANLLAVSASAARQNQVDTQTHLEVLNQSLFKQGIAPLLEARKPDHRDRLGTYKYYSEIFAIGSQALALDDQATARSLNDFSLKPLPLSEWQKKFLTSNV